MSRLLRFSIVDSQGESRVFEADFNKEALTFMLTRAEYDRYRDLKSRTSSFIKVIVKVIKFISWFRLNRKSVLLGNEIPIPITSLVAWYEGDQPVTDEVPLIGPSTTVEVEVIHQNDFSVQLQKGLVVNLDKDMNEPQNSDQWAEFYTVPENNGRTTYVADDWVLSCNFNPPVEEGESVPVFKTKDKNEGVFAYSFIMSISVDENPPIICSVDPLMKLGSGG